MNSHSLRMLAPHARLGWQLLRAEWPPAVWAVGRLLPEVIRTLVFVIIGGLVGGEDGMRFALIGCVVLSIATTAISEVTDIPVRDVQLGTYRAVSLAPLSPFLQLVARASALWITALIIAAVVVLVLPLTVGLGELTGPLLVRIWMVVPAVLAATMLGLVVIAPAIGSNWEGITYNGAVAVITVLSGAIFEVTWTVGAAIGDVLPLTHTIRALRASLTGDPWLGELLLEVAVGTMWAILGWLLYGMQDARGRRRGEGAFAA